jgi:hypothetical protein
LQKLLVPFYFLSIMKRRYSTTFVTLSLIIATVAFGQQHQVVNSIKNKTLPRSSGDVGMVQSSSPKGGIVKSPLSSLVSIPGTNILPIATKWDAATNGRSLHTLVRDPGDPLKLHFVAMVADDNTENDTAGGAFTSRRVAYTYSSDGGKTWKPQVYIDSSLRLGYPDILLYKRGTVNVPVIAAHNGPNSTGNANWTTKLYIEQGQPGDGKFTAFSADRKASDGKTKDIGYPSLSISASQDTLYILGCVLTTGTNPNQPLEFGKFYLDANRGATWLGWKSHPTGSDANFASVINGKDLLRVAPNGKLGAMWCSDSDFVCYVESKDAGNTWTTNFKPMYTPKDTSITASGGKVIECLYSGCDAGIDFWYDQTSVPTFFWQANWDSPRGGVYFPWLATGYLTWRMGESNAYSVTQYNAADLSAGLMMFDSTSVTVNTFNDVDYFSGPPASANYFGTALWNATPLITTDPKKWGVVYQTLQDGDELDGIDVFGDGSTFDTRLFRDIFFVKTTDGGVSWSSPTPFVANDPSSDPSIKIDYHFPATALYNPSSSGSLVSDVVFYADTCPGPVETGQAVWDDNSWFHKSLVFSGVKNTGTALAMSLDQNYPNPFNGSTTFPITMKNDEMVKVSITDMLGREVALIYNGRLSAGEHRIPFTAPNLGAGIYTYTLKTSAGSVSRTMSLVK